MAKKKKKQDDGSGLMMAHQALAIAVVVFAIALFLRLTTPPPPSVDMRPVVSIDRTIGLEAATVVLKNGEELAGVILVSTEDIVFLAMKERSREIPQADIERIDYIKPPAPEPAPE